MVRILFCFLLFVATFNPTYAHAQTALVSGAITTGSLIPGGTNSYTFTGTAGQGMKLHGKATYSVSIAIYKPSGGNISTFANRFSINSLPETGTYTVIISTNGGQSGPYSLYYALGGSTVSDGSLTSGTSVQADLGQYQLRSYNFSGNSGQGVFVYAAAGDTISIAVYKPDGSFLSSHSNRAELTLPSAGTYTVVVSFSAASPSGSYTLSYFAAGSGVSDPSLASGSVDIGHLGLYRIKSFEIEGKAGQYIMLYIKGTSNLTINGYKPDGSPWSSQVNRFTQTFPTTGTYTFAVVYSSSSGEGAYKMYNVRGADSVSEYALNSSQTATGYLPQTGLNSYTFSGISGNPISVNITSSFSRNMTLLSPDGSFWRSSANSFSATLPAISGEYTLVVLGSTTTATGTYSVTVTTASPPITPSDSEKNNIYGPEDGTCPAQTAGASPQPLVGNPINFDIGYKSQTENDYRGGNLSFTRIYRSDSTWTDNTMGALWRHNFSRTLIVTGSAAEIIDSSGSKSSYTLTGSNWVADASNITAKFASVTGGYSYTLPDNTREMYDTNKRLKRIEYLGGGALDLTYDGSGRLQSVTDENNRSLTLSYTAGRVTSITTPIGTFSYSYDGNGNLSEVEKPGSATREYHYEDVNFVHALTGITDENNIRFATYAYDMQGRAILSKHSGDVDSYEVDYNSGSVTTTNPLGKETTYYFRNIQGVNRIVQIDGHASANCVAANRYYNYDTNGWLLNKTDWQGNTTRYVRNNRGLVTQTIEAYETPQQRITNTEYETNFNLPRKITTGNRETSYTYDGFGRVTSASVQDLTTSEIRTTTYTYYANTTDGSGNTILGRVDTVTNPLGAVTKYTYNGDLLVQTVTQAHGETYAQTTSYTYDAAKRIATITEPNTAITTLTYDALSRILTTTRADGTALEAITTFTYDNNGNVTKVDMPNGTEVSYTYDNAQRLTGVEDALGNTITYTLDDAGNTTKTEYKDATPALKYTQSQMYDELSRLIKDINATSDESIYAYNKNSKLTSFTDANTNATAYSYDALQRLVKETDALSGETEYAYNTLDDNTGVTDARDNTTTYSYNAFGDVTQESSPDRGNITYEYDAAGNLTLRNNANGIVAEYAYDDLNRVTSITYPLDTSENTSYTYDSCTNGAGRVCSVTDASGTTAYEYDLLGRVTEVTETRGALTFTTAYAYDLAGVLTGVTLPSGRTVTYALNGNADVTGVTAPVAGSPVSLAGSIGYLPFGPATSMTYGNALAFTAAYDQNYWPTSRAVGGIFSNSYTTDDNGNITGIGGTDYGYDPLNRLDEEDSGSATAYTYDAVSNRLTKTSGSTVTTTVPAGNNKISAVGANAYTYDAVGNITNDGTREYVWDSLGHLREVKISASTVGAYTYNASHQRTQKVAGGTTTHYVYGAGGLLYGEYTGAGALIREYIYLNGEPLAQVNAGSPETVTYLHTDHLGTPKYGTNAAGAQVLSWAPDAFGNGAPTGSATVNLRMPGQYFDAESGIFYNWNRYYNPAIGRYISSDPIGLAGGINTFLYAGANPVMAADPEGLYSWWDFQGDIADGTISTLNGLAGLTDTLTLGQSRRYRQEQGLEYADPCSNLYKAGDWLGTGLGFVTGGAGIARGGLRIERGNWKQGGEWIAERGQKLLHFHWGKGLGLQKKHLPYESADWAKNFIGLIKKGEATEDLINMGITAAGTTSVIGGLTQSCGCK